MFQITADQRFALGEDIFLRTHWPAKFWVSHAGVSSVWSEGELLRRIISTDQCVHGNRLFVLFGATGSGKSEVMRWLLQKVLAGAPHRGQFTVRVNRTDIDPVRIVGKIADAFNLPNLSREALQRWNDLRQKPVALANQLVWQALSEMYRTDEEILPLSYRLRPIIESNLRSGLAAVEDPDVATRPLQLLSQEQLEQVINDTALNLEPVYEHLRSRLQQAFEANILGDVRLVSTLRLISQRVHQEHGIRPLLIIDDLVQSMNVYASDLMDFLITLDQGDWDVVLGVTPAAFEWDKRGREFLTRIRELDTVDDRVVKLDLSDTTGGVSSFLDADSMEGYLIPYLDLYKQAAGYTCGSKCSSYDFCLDFQWGMRKDTYLAPFNSAFLRRIWRHLPSGKGKARHLLLGVRTVLENLARLGSASLEDLSGSIERDIYVDHPDALVRTLWECWCPEWTALRPTTDTLPPALASLIDFNPDVTTEVRSLAQQAFKEEAAHVQASQPLLDPSRQAIVDWLNGQTVNPELLRPLRQGVARLIRDTVDPALLAGIGHAQPNGVLRWSEAKHGTTLPISIEGVDAESGIMLRRSVGSTAFDLRSYAEVTGRTRAQLANHLLESEAVIGLLHQAEGLRDNWITGLTTLLGCTIHELAFHAFRVASVTGAQVDRCYSFEAESNPPVAQMAWPSDLVDSVRTLWQDCFRLREHLWDGFRIDRYIRRWPTPDDSFSVLLRITASSVPDAYRLGDYRLSERLQRLQQHLMSLRTWLQSERKVVDERTASVEAAILLTDLRKRRALEREHESLVKAASTRFAVPELPSPPPPNQEKPFSTLAKSLRGLSPEGLNLYRLSASWAEALQSPWFRVALTWIAELRRLHVQSASYLTQATGVAADPVPSSLGVRDLIRGVVQMIEKANRHLGEQERLRDIRDVLTSAQGKQAHMLSTVLTALLPVGFRVTTEFAEEHAIAESIKGALGEARIALVSGDSQSVVSIELPRYQLLTRMQNAVPRICSWWFTYLEQLPLLSRPGRKPALSAVEDFLSQVAHGVEPGRLGFNSWFRFIGWARRVCTDLPIITRLNNPALPPDLADALRRTVEAGEEGVPLRQFDLSDFANLRKHLGPGSFDIVRITLWGKRGS